MKKILIILLLSLVVGLAFWLVGKSDWHLNRNKYNKLPKGNLKHVEDNNYTDDAGLSWELQPHIKNKFHQPEKAGELIENPYPNVEGVLLFDPKNPNLKFLCKVEKGASYEAILQPDGTYLTEGPKQGTYNYSHPGGFFGSLKHVFADVVPHFINSKYKG